MIKIGTDCSGIEAPIQALELLKVNYRHMFSCEIDKYAIKSIKANYKPEIIYDDVRKERNLPKIDIYVCGFPCQTFSTLGKMQGTKDPRGNIFYNCLTAIKKTDPSLFILENVSSILKFSIMDDIHEELGKLNYDVHYWVLNTKDYGIPQNRKRLFIIGLRKDKIINKLQFPEKINCKSIKSYVDEKCTKKDEYSNTYKKNYPQFKDSIFANLNVLFSKNINNRVSSDYCPTITANGETWCVYMQRRATINEYLSLQGFPDTFKIVVSERQIKKQVGNSMSVNVLVAIFKECFKSLCWNF